MAEEITQFSSDEEFDDEDSASSTDVDAKLAEEEVFDDEFFKCYSALKKKDSKIYDGNVKFFSEDKESPESDGETHIDDLKFSGPKLLDPERWSKAPKMTLLDHQLNMNQDEIEEPKVNLEKHVSKSFYEKELEEIKKSIAQIHDDSNSDSDDDLLKVKNPDGAQSKSKVVINSLLDKLEDEGDEDIKHLKDIWSDTKKLSDEDKFLRDYILNKRYIPRNDGEEQTSRKDRSAFFSENIDELSDVDDDESDQKIKTEGDKLKLHSSDKDFDKIARIPRNSTKTIRDLVEKQNKNEKRRRKLEKQKKKKQSIKDIDCEDIVGDLHTKFHYRETEPNDYGLSAEELLMATDEELEKWIKLRDAISYKSTEEELAQKAKYESMRNDNELKKKIFVSIYGESQGEDDLTEKSSTTKTKRSLDKSKEHPARPDSDADKDEAVVESGPSGKRKKKHKRGTNHKKFAKTGVAPDRLLAYGLSKNKLKKSKLL